MKNISPAFRTYCINKLCLPIRNPRCLQEHPYVIADIIDKFAVAGVAEVRDVICEAFALNCVDLDLFGGYGSYLQMMGLTPTEEEHAVIRQSTRHGGHHL